MDIARALAPYRRVGLDTPVFIYALERHPQFGSAAGAVLAAVQRGEVQAVASTLIVAELLVVPYRMGNRAAAAEYVAHLLRYPNLTLVPPDVEVCRAAAELRATRAGLRLPDALHLATALHSRADAFITNDAGLRQAVETSPMAVVQLADFTERT